MSWPILVIMLLNFFVGIVDVYIAGLLSPEIQAAVGFVSQLSFLTIVIANAISIGGIALISRAAGAGNFEKGIEIARQILIFGGAVAFLVMIPGLFFYREMVAITGFPVEIRETAGNFLRVYSLAMGSNYLLIISNSIFRANGEVKKPLITMSIVSALNVALNFILVFGIFSFKGLGYIGIAAASSISVTAGTVINLVFLSRGRWEGLYRRPWGFSLDIIKKTVSLSWPAALLQVAWNAGSIIIYNILGRLGSESITALAAITNGFRIEGLIFLPAFALNMAASVLIGQNLGAGNPERAERMGWKIALTGAGVMSVMAIIIFIFAGDITWAFTGNPAVHAETVRYLRINMISQPFMAMSVVLGGGLQGAGDTRGAMWVVGTAMWFIRLPLAWLFAMVLGFGARGVWAAMVISMAIQGSLMAIRFRGGKWKAMKI